MATQKQLQTLEKYVDVLHLMLINQAHGLQRLKDKESYYDSHRSVYERAYGQVLYDAPKIFTGMASIAMVDKKLHDFAAKPCPEHYLSRQKGGAELLKLMETSVLTGVDPPRELVLAIALTYCAVHYTTPEENTLLKKFQREHHDETAYARAGIVLIEARDLFTKRGHSDKWKLDMLHKYAPVVEHHLTSVGLIHDNQSIEDTNNG